MIAVMLWSRGIANGTELTAGCHETRTHESEFGLSLCPQLMKEEVVNELRDIKKRISSIQSTLEVHTNLCSPSLTPSHYVQHSAEHALDSRDDVQALVEMDRLQWNFKNFHVDHYRACAGK